ncbi:MAG TPA: sulfatase-like hydrolase/transferase [Bacilli bacterium]|nr:sulfatase-like hydrolase/transferase [Bacilli bacterium]
MRKIIGYYRKCDILTMCGTFLAFIGIILAINDHFTFSAFCLFLCGVCDGFDGKLARMKRYKKEQKVYGAQLDSLSDVICFGVFPVILTSLICNNIYVYIISAIYMLCGLVRLAYFNTLDIMPKSNKNVFIGVPITTVAIIYPIILFIIRFINFNILKIVMPIILLILSISYILNIEFKKPDIIEMLKKIFNKYTVNLICFPMFILFISDLFYKINGFGGRVYFDVFKSIFSNFLPFLFLTLIFSLLTLLLTALFNDSKKAKIVILVLTLILLFVNDIKYSIMGIPIELTDVGYLNPDNMNMMGTATSSIGLWIIKSIIKAIVYILLGMIITVFDKYHNLKFNDLKKRVIIPIISIIILVVPFLFNNHINNFVLKRIYTMTKSEILAAANIDQLYYEKGYFQGMYLDTLGNKFVLPDQYSKKNAQNAINDAVSKSSPSKWKKANVVVLLSESFSDPQRLSGIEYDKELMPNIKSYEKDDDKIVTDLLVNPYGTLSTNSEFEVLTGASLVFFNPSYVAYNQYYNNSLKEKNQSLINEFNNNGYETMYLTPWGETSYRSKYVYSILGADKTIYGKDLNGKLKGTFYSDESIVNDIYDRLKTTSKGNYKFIMAASGQNHFPYLDKYKESDYDVKIKSTKYDKEATNMFRSYAQGIYDADKALNQLYKKIQNLDTPTIVVMFGDHQPYMGKKDNTSDYLQNSYFNTNDEIINDIRLHTTKAVILANFKLDTSDNLEFINSSYLGAYVLNKMDLKVSDYFKFIDYSRKTIPVFNRSVIYNSKTNTYTKMDQATKQEKGAINNYKNVQYYKFFDFE